MPVFDDLQSLYNTASDYANFHFTAFKNSHIDETNYFNVHRLHQLDNDPGIKGIPYVFITTPSLNLSDENINKDGFFGYLRNTNPDLLYKLSYDRSPNGFITLFSNRFSEFTVPDMTSQTKEVAETWFGYFQNLPNYTPTADTANITYIDNSNMDVLDLHKVWFDYIKHVTRGDMVPSQTMKERKLLDYTASIYHFVVDYDGETIQYWDKLTGCSPISVPWGEFSSKVANNAELIEYTVEYAYSHKEAKNVSILYDFNAVSNKTTAARLASGQEFSSNLYATAGGNTYMRSLKDDYEETDLSHFKRPLVALDEETGRFKLKFV